MIEVMIQRLESAKAGEGARLDAAYGAMQRLRYLAFEDSPRGFGMAI